MRNNISFGLNEPLNRQISDFGWFPFWLIFVRQQIFTPNPRTWLHMSPNQIGCYPNAQPKVELTHFCGDEHFVRVRQPAMKRNAHKIDFVQLAKIQHVYYYRLVWLIGQISISNDINQFYFRLDITVYSSCNARCISCMTIDKCESNRTKYSTALIKIIIDCRTWNVLQVPIAFTFMSSLLFQMWCWCNAMWPVYANTIHDPLKVRYERGESKQSQ